MVLIFDVMFVRLLSTFLFLLQSISFFIRIDAAREAALGDIDLVLCLIWIKKLGITITTTKPVLRIVKLNDFLGR